MLKGVDYCRAFAVRERKNIIISHFAIDNNQCKFDASGSYSVAIGDVHMCYFEEMLWSSYCICVMFISVDCREIAMFIWYLSSINEGKVILTDILKGFDVLKCSVSEVFMNIDVADFTMNLFVCV